jgi:preprotein translocase subunit SecD
MLKLALSLLIFTTPALADDPLLTFAFKDEKLELDASGISDASVPSSQQSSEPVVYFRLSKTAARAFGELTSRYVNEPMDIIVCGRLISSPIIRDPIFQGVAQISGTFTIEEARALATMLKEGRCGVTGRKPGAGSGDGVGGGKGAGDENAAS